MSVRLCIAAAGLLLAGSGVLQSPAYAGVYIAPTINWTTLTPRPEPAETVQSYYGFGGSLGGGYSFAQVFDVGAYGSYVPLRAGSAALGANDALLSSYGAELALRLADSVYVGLRGGVARYELSRDTRPDEITGSWQGPSGAFSIGAITRLSKQSFLQTSLDVMHTVVQCENEDECAVASVGSAAEARTVPNRRRFDTFGVSFGYVFNGDGDSRSFKNTILGDFIDALSFF